jgi:hypothetical protein
MKNVVQFLQQKRIVAMDFVAAFCATTQNRNKQDKTKQVGDERSGI